MNAENELTSHKKKTLPLFLRSLWVKFWRGIVVGMTLFCTYSLFAVWGLIMLVILAARQIRKVLYWEAQQRD